MNGAPSNPTSDIGQPLPPGRAFLVLLAVVALLAGYVALAYLLQIAAIFAGSLFLFFWVGVEKAAPAAFMATLVGAIGGVANGILLHASVAAVFGVNPGVAALVGVGLLFLAVYMVLIHKGQILFNQSYMLFVTVAAIPMLSNRQIFVSMIEGIFLSAAYFGVIFWILRRIGARRELNSAAEALAADVPLLDDVSRSSAEA
jgi:hypothetical protein